MSYKSIILVINAMLMAGVTIAQTESTSIYNKYEGVASEKVYIGTNTTLLFTGEYLYYAVFCLDDRTKQPSTISSLAYVHLISEEGETIFKHKVGLVNSRGQGEFFVPTTVKSGNYKLIGFTKWMRNGDPRLFFQEDISIINPYQGDQKSILDNDQKTNGLISETSIREIAKDKRFILETDKKQYSKRSHVKLKIKNFRGASGFGNYLVSVRRKSEFNSQLSGDDPINFIEKHKTATKGQLPKYTDIKHLPEELGERIVGKVVPKSEGVNVADKIVAVSIPGEDFQLKAAITDEKGDFFFDIFQQYSKPILIAQVLDGQKDNLKIIIEHDSTLEFKDLKFKKFHIDSTMKNAILKRSVHNQIENAYFEARPDTLKTNDLTDSFWGTDIETYDLDDYTRFPTLMETMVEILPFASIRKDGRDSFTFNVRLFDTYEGPQRSAMVFIDGMLITSHKRIVEFDSKLIKRILVVRDRFELAGRHYRGMINIETINKDYYEWANEDYITKVGLRPINRKKRYFKQRYTPELEKSNNHIPDYRHQLLWEPDMELQSSEANIDFFTSDVAGVYDIKLEGFSIFGRPVSLQATFVVE